MRTLWALMDTENLDAAKQSLALREGIKTENIEKNIGAITTSDTIDDRLINGIKEWVSTLKLDAAIWTSLKPKFGKEDRPPSLIEALKYLRDLDGQSQRAAEEYIRRAPKQIDTLFRQEFEKEFNWTSL